MKLAAFLLVFTAYSSAQTLRIVCFGDSTTAPRAGVVPYCDHLRNSGLDAINRGVPGNTTEDARRRFATDVLDAKPAIVIIQFGLNDSTVDVWKNPPATLARVSLDRYRENLRYFVDAAQTAGARVILMTFNPVRWTPKLTQLYGKPPYRPEDADGFNTGRREYLEAVRSVARDRKTQLVDVHTLFAPDADRLLPDGMHPNSQAHRLLADRLLPLLTR